MAGFTQKTIDFIKSIISRRQDKGPLGEEKFALVVSGLPEETFTVVKFSTEGELNRCYRAELLMVSRHPRLDIGKMIMSPAFAFIKRDEGTFVPFSGIMAEMEELRKVDDYFFYRAVIVPKLWLLTRTRNNRIFLGITIPKLLEEVLVDGGLTRNEFEFRFQNEYPRKWGYICQYGESHFDFFSRWLEYAGMYFYFEVTDEGEKLIITDTRIVHTPPPFSSTLQYRPSAGLEAGHWDELLTGFSACYASIPKSVTLRDYNYRRPSLELTGTADISEQGVGEVFVYGEHFRTPEEANHIAKIRAEEISCRQTVFRGESRAPFLRPGFIFEVQGHYQEKYNRRYMVTGIEHHGNQASFLTTGLRRELAAGEREPFYRNTFTAIPADVQYRPPRITPKPRFYGVINAHIDAESSGEYAELDKYGRYKVMLPFDLSGRKGGKASAWLRMAQPYVGSNHGMHFPLHKGTEVLLTFIDGDPDRPIIAGAVPNPHNPSVINDQIATRAGFVTPGGASLVTDDTAGNEEIALMLGSDAGYGAKNDNLGGNVSSWGNYAWHYAGVGAIALANLFKFDAGASTYIRTIGFKKDWLGVFNALMQGSLHASALMPEGKKASDPSSLLEKIVPATALVIDLIMYKLIEKSVKSRIKSKVSTFTPDLGYGIYCDEKGAITYMKAPWKKDNPDIGIISTKCIDIVAGKTINIQADSELRAGAAKDVHIYAGDVGVDGVVKVTGDKIDIKATSRGVSISGKQDGVRISSSFGNIDIQSTSSPIRLSRQDDAGKVWGMVQIDSMGNIKAQSRTGKIALEAGEATLTMSAAGFIEVKATHGLTIMVGDNRIEVEPAGITISSPYDVKINELTVSNTNLSYKGQTANIANVLKVK